MYNFLKKHIKSIFPKRFLFKNEILFRYPYAIFYLGNSHVCNICSKHLRSFIKLNNSDLMCPFCGSLSRNRRLFNLLEESNDFKGKMLHFSPSRNLYRHFKKSKHIEYYSTDYEGEFLADYKFDITQINQESDTFDLILCYHVLEHILDDKKAISELYRVLKPNGKIYLQTPFKDGEIYEDASIVTQEERKIHFGQEDHVRIYSVNGLKNRLEDLGFNVEVKTYNRTENEEYYGFMYPETVLITTKTIA